jgi:hypothetical protein
MYNCHANKIRKLAELLSHFLDYCVTDGTVSVFLLFVTVTGMEEMYGPPHPVVSLLHTREECKSILPSF